MFLYLTTVVRCSWGMLQSPSRWSEAHVPWAEAHLSNLPTLPWNGRNPTAVHPSASTKPSFSGHENKAWLLLVWWGRQPRWANVLSSRTAVYAKRERLCWESPHRRGSGPGKREGTHW